MPSRLLGWCPKLAALALLALAAATADADDAEGIIPLPVANIAPGVYVHVGAVAVMTAENEGATANLGLSTGT